MFFLFAPGCDFITIQTYISASADFIISSVFYGSRFDPDHQQKGVNDAKNRQQYRHSFGRREHRPVHRQI